MKIAAITKNIASPRFKGIDDKISLLSAIANRQSVIRKQNIVDVDRGLVGQIVTTIKLDSFTRETTITDGHYVFTEEVKRYLPDDRNPQTYLDLLDE